MENFCLDGDIEEIIEGLGETAGAFEGKTILLTGGRGFLGRYFTAVFGFLNKKVFSSPCKLIAVDNLITAGETGAKKPEFEEGYTFIQHDVIQPFHPTGAYGAAGRPRAARCAAPAHTAHGVGTNPARHEKAGRSAHPGAA